MKKSEKVSRYVVEISSEECKGCGKCIIACPKKILALSDKINSYGFRFAVCIEDSCVGCGNCFYSCPEPGAIKIYLQIPDDKEPGASVSPRKHETERKKECNQKQKKGK